MKDVAQAPGAWWAILVAHVVVVLAVTAASRRSGASWRGLGTVAVGVVAAWASAWLMLAPALPVSAFSPLREGFGEARLEVVALNRLDTDALDPEFWRPWVWPVPLALRWAMAHGIAMQGTAVLLAVAYARRAGLGWPTTLALGLALGRSSAGVVAAVSGTAAPTTAVLLWLVAHAWRSGASPPARPPALVALVTLVPVLLLARPELALVPVLAAVSLVAPEGPLVALRRRPLLAAGAVACWLFVALVPRDPPLPEVPGPAGLDWVVAGLHPLGPYILRLPVELATFLPLGLVLLATTGAALAAAGRRAGLGWAVAVGVLGATYRVAAHGPVFVGDGRHVALHELHRYLLLLAPILAVLAVQAVAGWGARARLWAGILLLVPEAPGAARALDPVHPVEVAPAPWRGRVETDSMAAVRDLAAWVEAHPGCAVVTKALGWPAIDGVPRWYVLQPIPGGHVVRRPDVPSDAPLAVAAGSVVGTCAVGWVDLDCGSVPAAACAELEVLEPLATPRTLGHRPSVHPDHGPSPTRPVPTGPRKLPGSRPEPP